jgi:hypothetical protein
MQNVQYSLSSLWTMCLFYHLKNCRDDPTNKTFLYLAVLIKAMKIKVPYWLLNKTLFTIVAKKTLLNGE